ncbi:MAG: hypothetical protein RLZZ244_91 [Verrucomicrobiota bacterium]|jgi:glutaminyl-peptide cyclotransferase
MPDRRPASFRPALPWLCLGLIPLLLDACNRSASPAKNPAEAAALAATKAQETTPARPAPAELWKHFDGARALAAAKAQIDCGPRPAGSPALETARGLILESLRQSGWTTELQQFVEPTPHGPKTFVNVIARFASKPASAPNPASQRAVVASHYDTKSFSSIAFLGANDGASSTGALLELATTLALDPRLASQIELVFFDGEEAFQQFTETDGLYGSRFYARSLLHSGRHTQFQFALLWDMIGDRNLSITFPLDSPKDLLLGLYASADALQARPSFGLFDRPILDDHVPLRQIARIPAIDIIDFDYAAWHTADDTLSQLSAESLQTVGKVTLHFLKQRLP